MTVELPAHLSMDGSSTLEISDLEDVINFVDEELDSGYFIDSANIDGIDVDNRSTFDIDSSDWVADFELIFTVNIEINGVEVVYDGTAYGGGGGVLIVEGYHQGSGEPPQIGNYTIELNRQPYVKPYAPEFVLSANDNEQLKADINKTLQKIWNLVRSKKEKGKSAPEAYYHMFNGYWTLNGGLPSALEHRALHWSHSLGEVDYKMDDLINRMITATERDETDADWPELREELLVLTDEINEEIKKMRKKYKVGMDTHTGIAADSLEDLKAYVNFMHRSISKTHGIPQYRKEFILHANDIDIDITKATQALPYLTNIENYWMLNIDGDWTDVPPGHEGIVYSDFYLHDNETFLKDWWKIISKSEFDKDFKDSDFDENGSFSEDSKYDFMELIQTYRFYTIDGGEFVTDFYGDGGDSVTEVQLDGDNKIGYNLYRLMDSSDFKWDVDIDSLTSLVDKRKRTVREFAPEFKLHSPISISTLVRNFREVDHYYDLEVEGDHWKISMRGSDVFEERRKWSDKEFLKANWEDITCQKFEDDWKDDEFSEHGWHDELFIAVTDKYTFKTVDGGTVEFVYDVQDELSKYGWGSKIAEEIADSDIYWDIYMLDLVERVEERATSVRDFTPEFVLHAPPTALDKEEECSNSKYKHNRIGHFSDCDGTLRSYKAEYILYMFNPKSAKDVARVLVKYRNPSSKTIHAEEYPMFYNVKSLVEFGNDAARGFMNEYPCYGSPDHCKEEFRKHLNYYVTHIDIIDIAFDIWRFAGDEIHDKYEDAHEFLREIRRELGGDFDEIPEYAPEFMLSAPIESSEIDLSVEDGAKRFMLSAPKKKGFVKPVSQYLGADNLWLYQHLIDYGNWGYADVLVRNKDLPSLRYLVSSGNVITKGKGKKKMYKAVVGVLDDWQEYANENMFKLVDHLHSGSWVAFRDIPGTMLGKQKAASKLIGFGVVEKGEGRKGLRGVFYRLTPWNVVKVPTFAEEFILHSQDSNVADLKCATLAEERVNRYMNKYKDTSNPFYWLSVALFDAYENWSNEDIEEYIHEWHDIDYEYENRTDAINYIVNVESRQCEMDTTGDSISNTKSFIFSEFYNKCIREKSKLPTFAKKFIFHSPFSSAEDEWNSIRYQKRYHWIKKYVAIGRKKYVKMAWHQLPLDLRQKMSQDWGREMPTYAEEFILHAGSAEEEWESITNEQRFKWVFKYIGSYVISADWSKYNWAELPRQFRDTLNDDWKGQHISQYSKEFVL